MKELNSQKIQNKLRNKFLNFGVKMTGPETIFFSNDTKIGKKVVIEPYVVISKNVKIGNNVTISSFSHLEGVKIDNNVDIGPYARIRPGVVIKSGSKIGNFVETKKALVGKGSKINHLSYVGDAELGEEVNIGAGTITCNYDGVNKHKTSLGDKVFIGSNSTLVAPINVDNGSFVAAGSPDTSTVPKDSLAEGRANQRNIDGWTRPTRKGKID